jgi:hypothetical protein
MIVTALFWMGWLVFATTEVAATTATTTTIAACDDCTYQEHCLLKKYNILIIVPAFDSSQFYTLHAGDVTTK